MTKVITRRGIIGIAGLAALTASQLATYSADAVTLDGTASTTIQAPVSGLVTSSSGLGSFTVTGTVAVTVPRTVVPPNPVKFSTTILNMTVTNVSTRLACAATGTSVFTTTTTTGDFTSVYGIPTDPCKFLGSLSIRYLIGTSATGQPTATVTPVDVGGGLIIVD